MHLITDMRDIVVNHRQCYAHRQDGYNREGDSRIGHELVRFDACFKVHPEIVSDNREKAIKKE